MDLVVAVRLAVLLVFLAAVAGFVVLPFVALIQALLTPVEAWGAVRRSKVRWTLALFLLGVFAAVPYWYRVRPGLRRAAELERG